MGESSGFSILKSCHGKMNVTHQGKKGSPSRKYSMNLGGSLRKPEGFTTSLFKVFD